MKHNNVIPNNHFRKKWQFMVKTWFNQPARKTRRRNARAAKAKAVFPRPAGGVLKPLVRGQTIKYNSKQRLGKGFTLEELKEAGIARGLAPTIGISVDHRRRNRSVEGMQTNVARLKAYKANLVLFPRDPKKPKASDSPAEARSAVVQAKGKLLPAPTTKPALESIKLTKEMKDVRAYNKLRIERVNARLVGARAAKAKAEAAKAEAA